MALDPNNVMSWTFAVPKLGLPRTRVHWAVLLLIAFDMVGMAHSLLPWWLLPAVVPLFWLAHYAHECGHVLMGRWVKASVLSIEIHMLSGGRNDVQLPMKPWRLMAYAASGPLGNLACAGLAWGISWALPADSRFTLPSELLRYLVYANLREALFNAFFPIYPFDAGLFERAFLWPITGLHRAVKIVLVHAYISCALALGFGIWQQNMMVVMLGLSVLYNLAMEHRSIKEGYDPWLQADPRYSGSNKAIWQGWSERRRQRAAERIDQEEAREQEVLDRLLAKVTEQGLPSLTAGERTQLEHISQRQRARQNAG